MLNNSLQVTNDGSHTVFSEKFNAHYHSIHGAIQESIHVFIESGLEYYSPKKQVVNILEMGFGTGLNLLLTYIYSEKLNANLYFETIEAYPISSEEAQDLNYIHELSRTDLDSFFKSIHSSSWDAIHTVSNTFQYKKHLCKIEDVLLDQKYDIVYYDAFAPNCQEELWTPEIFSKIAKSLKPDAVLVSYCAKGSFKRALQSAGFEIQKIPGPPGKREMIRGIYRA